jgi:hypothetical protein
MITCKECGKVITHESGFCLQHRHAWREGFKAGVTTNESVGDRSIALLIKDLGRAATHPMVKHLGFTPLLIRSANALKRLDKK